MNSEYQTPPVQTQGRGGTAHFSLPHGFPTLEEENKAKKRSQRNEQQAAHSGEPNESLTASADFNASPEYAAQLYATRREQVTHIQTRAYMAHLAKHSDKTLPEWLHDLSAYSPEALAKIDEAMNAFSDMQREQGFQEGLKWAIEYCAPEWILKGMQQEAERTALWQNYEREQLCKATAHVTSHSMNYADLCRARGEETRALSQERILQERGIAL
ncbi:hypothetical protein [Actinomyces vulturis]|uniref:hypothetical protein n=1 Tax=Actinomyces vulturis TaxID=1857645 RepID=UPI0008338107|nr:hypothetical protein [Actinomyces vulturis]